MFLLNRLRAGQDAFILVFRILMIATTGRRKPQPLTALVASGLLLFLATGAWPQTAGVGITKIFVSDKVRTQDTARPLANFLGQKCNYSTNLLHAWDGNQVFEYVKTNVVANDIVLIVFHGDFDKLPFLLRRLGGPDNEIINGFDKMYLFRPDPSVQFLSMTRRVYGKPSP